MRHAGSALVIILTAALGPVVTTSNCLAASPPHAAGEATISQTTVRSGNHKDFGRVVIDTTRKNSYRLDRDGDSVTLHFRDDVALGSAPSVPRDMLSVSTHGAVVELTLKHGTGFHASRLDGRVVLDALDPPYKSGPDPNKHADKTPPPKPDPMAQPEQKAPVSRRPAQAVPTEHTNTITQPNDPATTGPTMAPRFLTMASSAELGGRSPKPPTRPQAPLAAAPVAVEAQPLSAPSKPGVPQSNVAQQATIDITQQTPPGRDVMPEGAGPLGLRARRLRLPKEMDGSAFLVPFGSTTAAAAFQHGGITYIAFDERRPIDMAALRNDPVFGDASVQLLAQGTLVRLKLPPTRFMALTQMPQGWRIAALAAQPRLRPVPQTFSDGRLNLADEQSATVISMADPDTGATLLVGTQHRPGQGVAMTRRSTDFILHPTLQGVVVEPLADSIVLRPVPSGFVLGGGPAGLALSPPMSMTDMMMEAAHLTRRLSIPTFPTAVLLQDALKQVAGAAAAPPLARGPIHRAAAQSLMALGFSAEAESLLHMASDQDPKEAASAQTGFLTAIAALLAGRPKEAKALADSRLDGTDEIALWRAVRHAMLDEGSPAAAAVFASTAPLVAQYPQAIRDHILPLIVETMVQGGALAPAARLLNAFKDDPVMAPKLAYANALMREANGSTAQALTMLDALAAGHDQFDRARAAVRAVELRLTAGTLDKTQAADALDKLLYAWRGDARELALRERIADLRSQTGAWHLALAGLRQAETDFPEQAMAIKTRLKGMFVAMIRDQGFKRTPPLEFVAMVDENTDLIPAAADDEPLEQALADRLVALDLPDRAKPVLQKLLRTAKSTIAKARFGVSLATLDQREGNDAGAKADLLASEGPDLPPDLTEQRMILLAQTVARLGKPAEAVASLAQLRTGHTTAARAQILEDAADWAGAAQAWADCVSLTVPASGLLDQAAAKTVLRLATATARANDDAGLADLRARFNERFGTGPIGDMFRLLTAEPIRTSGDIGRSQREMSLAASLPTDLKALQASRGTR
jgi:hypothetical protein